jgi:hypothetical protein
VKVLLDECVPKRLARLLPGHEVRTVPQMGWAGVRNGRLLSLAGAAPFDVLITVDRNIEHQHNLATLPLAVVVVEAPSNDIDDLLPLAPAILSALAGLVPNRFTHVGPVP